MSKKASKYIYDLPPASSGTPMPPVKQPKVERDYECERWLIAAAVAAERERCVKCAEAEPEPEHLTPMVCAIIRAVKDNIIARITAAPRRGGEA